LSALAGLAPALLLGLVARLGPILIADFPLGDGALFAAMAADIRAAGFGLPEFATYNAAEIPFVYPPLGLYLLAAVPGDLVATERWLPLAWSLLAIAGAWLLARELFDDLVAGVAAACFAAMPLAWAIEGGGVTRALGLALLLLALWRFAVLARQPGPGNAALAGALAGAALLSHPAVGPTGLASAALLLAWRFSPRAAGWWLGALVVGGAVVAPWLWLVVDRHGLDLLVSGFTSHAEESQLVRIFVYGPSWLAPLDLLLAPALLGAVLCVRERRWLLPAWLALLLIVPGGGGRYATVAWAMLAAVGVVALLPVLRNASVVRAATAVGFVALLVVALSAGYQRFHAIPADARRAMADVRERASVDARFAVVTDVEGEDPVVEWFPLLTGRHSLGTYMGLEWAGEQRWQAALDRYTAIRNGLPPADADHVFIVDEGRASWSPMGR
jgi:hypothetical protein